MVAAWIIGMLTLLLELWLAFQAARFYVEGKASGFLELLLTTLARKIFFAGTGWGCVGFSPILAVSDAGVVERPDLGVLQTLAMAAMPMATGSPPQVAAMRSIRLAAVASAVTGAASWLTGLAAIAAFGMWMGLKSNKTSAATLKTLCFVKILPCIGVYAGLGGLIGIFGSFSVYWLPRSSWWSLT